MRKVKLNKLQATGTTTGDVYFPQTKLLLPFDGANGATTTSDSSNLNHTITLSNGAQISTAQSKFGGSSLLLDGTNDDVNVGSSNSVFTWGTNDFTIECWIYLNSIGSNENIFSHSSSGVGIEFLLDGSSGLKIYIGGGSWFINGTTTSSSGISTGQWIHVALVRNGSNFDTYVDGTKGGTTASSATSITAPSNNAFIGSNRGGSNYIDGYIDDFRITMGIARYTSSFTPPTTAYLTSAGDVNKQILINSTADGVAIGTGGINQARIAKAWVNFDGSGTVAIRASYNVSSITDNSTGNYTVNFTTAMPDTNYSAVMYTNTTDYGMASGNFNNTYTGGLNTRSTSSLRFESYGPPGYQDALLCDLIVFGN
ncbi:MAG: hypothetical protein CME35_00940 [Gramella sp.]|nr:hypothetical protein [Christiangramia sp.]